MRMSRRDAWLDARRGVEPRSRIGLARRAGAGAAGLIVSLLIWEAISAANWLPAHSFPSATAVMANLAERLTDRATWDAVRATLHGWGIGLVIAVPLAAVVGMVVGASDTLFSMVRPLVEFLRPVPSVALIPVGVLLFGVDIEVKVFLIAYAVFFPMLYQAIYGVRSADRVALETAEVYGLGWGGRARYVVLPSAAPYLMTGLRLASSIALVLAVTAELIVGTAGLGDEIATAQAIGDYEAMYAFILMTGLLGIGLNSLFRRIDHGLVRWSVDRREATT